MDELTHDVVAFISDGTRTGQLGYTASDGRPLVAPIWFVVDNGVLAFNTGRDTAKGRALARDPRAVICVDDERPPYSFVQVQAPSPSARIPKTCATSRRGQARGTWAGSGPRSTAAETAYQGNWWCDCIRRRCSRLSTWPNSNPSRHGG